jgi:hypothetical protein
VLATLSTTRTASLRAAGDAAPSALTSGYHLAFTIAVALVVAALALAVTLLRTDASPTPSVSADDVRGVRPAFSEE